MLVFLYRSENKNMVVCIQMQGVGMLIEGIFGAAVGNTASV